MEDETYFVGQKVRVLEPEDPTDPHDIPVGTVCEINTIYTVEDYEYPYELKNLETGEVYPSSVRQCEIEVVGE